MKRFLSHASTHRLRHLYKSFKILPSLCLFVFLVVQQFQNSRTFDILATGHTTLPNGPPIMRKCEKRDVPSFENT